MASYCSNLLTVEENGISLDTGLSPREAAQSKLPQFLKENGYIASRDSDGMWQFTPWTWDDTKTAIPAGRKTESVFVTGPAWEGVPLYSLLSDAMAETASSAEYTRAADAVNLLNQAVEAAAASASVQLPVSGPAAVLCGTGTNQGTLLFLPAELFVRALQSRGDNERSRYQGIWINPVLSGLDAWRFTVAACAFALLYGKPAYTCLDSEKREEDCLDKNHIPLAACVSGQSSELLHAIEHNLDQQGAVSKKVRKGQKTASDAIIARETVHNSYSVEMPAVKAFSERVITDPETLSQWQNFQKRLKRIRFMRKHQTALKITAAALAVFVIVLVTVIRDAGDRPTTAGLTQDEVVQMYYKGIDTLDATLFDAARYKSGGGWSNYVSTLFVTSKMRENYESIHTWTPGQWLYVRDPANASCFGISNLSYTRIHEYDDESVDYHTQFYIIQLGGELTVTRYTCNLTVSRVKKNFRVTVDESEEEPVSVNLELFKSDLNAAFDAAGDDEDCVIQVTTALHETYPWMPSLEDITRGKEQLESGEYQ